MSFSMWQKLMAISTLNAVVPAVLARRAAVAVSFTHPSEAIERSERARVHASLPTVTHFHRRAHPSKYAAPHAAAACRFVSRVACGHHGAANRRGQNLQVGSEPVGSLEVALAHAARLLATQPRLALEQAQEILKVAPGHPLGSLLLGRARRACGESGTAAQVLEALVARHPQWALAHYELGITLAALGQGDGALAALRRAVQLAPDLPQAWLALAAHLHAIGDETGAEDAYARHIKCSTRDPRLQRAAAALVENQIPQAEALLRAHLKERPTEVAAIRMLAEVAARLERFPEAEALLARCLELAPTFSAARRNYALVLHRQYQDVRALEEVDRLLAKDPSEPSFRNLKAAILGGLGRYQESIDLYAGILARYPSNDTVWMNYGHALKTAGRQEEGIAAYRRCLQLTPGSGAAYWSLANLKTFHFNAGEIEAMRAQLARDRTGRGRAGTAELRSRQGPGGCRRVCGLVSPLRGGQSSAARPPWLQRRPHQRAA